MPAWLREAVNEHRAHTSPDLGLPCGKPGEVVLVQGPWCCGCPPARVAVVVDRRGNGSVVIQLATVEIEMVTDLDLMVPAGVAAPYALAIQAELHAVVSETALRRLIGKLGEAETIALRNALATDGESLEDLATGIALSGPDDPRRRFKEQELVELAHLVHGCLRRVRPR